MIYWWHIEEYFGVFRHNWSGTPEKSYFSVYMSSGQTKAIDWRLLTLRVIGVQLCMYIYDVPSEGFIHFVEFQHNLLKHFLKFWILPEGPGITQINSKEVV